MIESDRALLVALAAVFAPLSLISFGGGPAVFAEMQRQAVALHGWTTQREFVDLFAISRIAPGPGALLATLIGWKAAGWLGAVVASFAFFLTSTVIAYTAARVWERWRGRAWHATIESGMAPVAAGLVMAGAISILRAEPASVLVWATALFIAAVRIRLPAIHPLGLLAVGALVFSIAEILR
jgi:chromate transporter